MKSRRHHDSLRPDFMKTPPDRPSFNADEEDGSEISLERRQALNKIAAWTPPVMLTLLLSPRPSAASPENEESTPNPGNF